MIHGAPRRAMLRIVGASTDRIGAGSLAVAVVSSPTSSLDDSSWDLSGIGASIGWTR